MGFLLNLSRKLESRRKQLGMPYETISKLSGVSRSTVIRVLSDEDIEAVKIAHVVAVANSLGVTIGEPPLEEKSPYEMLQHQAHTKARELVGITQATLALEGQGLPANEYENLVNQTTHELMAKKSHRVIWAQTLQLKSGKAIRHSKVRKVS